MLCRIGVGTPRCERTDQTHDYLHTDMPRRRSCASVGRDAYTEPFCLFVQKEKHDATRPLYAPVVALCPTPYRSYAPTNNRRRVPCTRTAVRHDGQSRFLRARKLRRSGAYVRTHYPRRPWRFRETAIPAGV